MENAGPGWGVQARAFSPGTLDVEGNTWLSGGGAYYGNLSIAGPWALDVKNNRFAGSILVDRTGPPNFSWPGGSPDLSGLELTGSDKNKFIGSGPNGAAQITGYVPSGKSWELSPASGAIIVAAVHAARPNELALGKFALLGAARLIMPLGREVIRTRQRGLLSSGLLPRRLCTWCPSTGSAPCDGSD